MYVQDVNGDSHQRPFGRGGALTGWDSPVISGDGRFVVRDSARRPFLQSLAGDDPRPVHGRRASIREIEKVK
jgi:hypothetical protein